VKEGQLIKLIFDRYWLEPGYHVRRMNTAKLKVKGFWIQYGENGQPDLEIIVPPYGRICGIECKSKTQEGFYKIGPKKGQPKYKMGIQEPDQIAYEEKIVKTGAIYAVCWTMEEVEAAVEKAQKINKNSSLH